MNGSAGGRSGFLGFLSISDPYPLSVRPLPVPCRGVHPSYQGSHLSLVPGTKTGADISDSGCEPVLASPASHTNPFPVLHLVEDLRLALEMLEQPQERAALLSQIPGPTAAYIKESLVSGPVARSGGHWEHNHITTGRTECHTAWDCYLICVPSSLFLLPIRLWPEPPLAGPFQQEGRAPGQQLRLHGQPACGLQSRSLRRETPRAPRGEQKGEFFPAGLQAQLPNYNFSGVPIFGCPPCSFSLTIAAPFTAAPALQTSLPWDAPSLERDAGFLTPLPLSLDQGCMSASL